jgi:hypothetical protein
VRRALRACVEHLESVITVEDLFGVEVVEFECLVKLEEMFVQARAFELFDDVFLAAAAMGITMPG